MMLLFNGPVTKHEEFVSAKSAAVDKHSTINLELLKVGSPNTKSLQPSTFMRLIESGRVFFISEIRFIFCLTSKAEIAPSITFGEETKITLDKWCFSF